MRARASASSSSAQPPLALAKKLEQRIDHRARRVEHHEIHARRAQLVLERLLAKGGARRELVAELIRARIDETCGACLCILKRDEPGGRHLGLARIGDERADDIVLAVRVA